MKKGGAFLFIVAFLFSCVDHNTFNPKVQFKNDTTSLSSYIKSFDPGAIKLSQGVWYSADTTIGIYPVLSDSVKISYSAWEIPSLIKRDTSYALTKLLSSAISGLQIGLLRFTAGSQGRLYIPSGLAYGTTGNDSIPPNTNLLYKIKLISVKGNHLTTDTTSLRSYVSSVVVADSLLWKRRVYKDATGIFYSYDTLYSSPIKYPTLSSTIQVSIMAGVLKSKTLFANASDTTLLLKNQIAALKVILPKISEGSSVNIFVPSGYGYGSAYPTTKIPANSNLVYNVKLIKVY